MKTGPPHRQRWKWRATHRKRLRPRRKAQRTHISRKMGRRSANEKPCKKDLKSAFTGMIGWVLCAFVVVVVGLYFYGHLPAVRLRRFQPGALQHHILSFVVVPLLTMRSIVEERRQKNGPVSYLPRPIAGIVGENIWHW